MLVFFMELHSTRNAPPKHAPCGEVQSGASLDGETSGGGFPDGRGVFINFA